MLEARFSALDAKSVPPEVVEVVVVSSIDLP
jgi:hypothetical protein